MWTATPLTPLGISPTYLQKHAPLTSLHKHLMSWEIAFYYNCIFPFTLKNLPNIMEFHIILWGYLHNLFWIFT